MYHAMTERKPKTVMKLICSVCCVSKLYGYLAVLPCCDRLLKKDVSVSACVAAHYALYMRSVRFLLEIIAQN